MSEYFSSNRPFQPEIAQPQPRAYLQNIYNSIYYFPEVPEYNKYI